ncbi:MAG: NADH-quinone oxidoreductase subunit J [Flavobacteriales bacterium]|jgi:NADH-quinone oxidoreductase subunit J
MLTEYAFWFLSFVAIFSAIAVVLTKNPVYSVLYLIVTFFSIAGHYFLMNAQFLAAVHIIVYAGAIMVLFLYVIMMLNLNKLEDERKKLGTKALSVVASCLLMFVVVSAMRRTDELNAMEMPGNTATVGLTKNLGIALFRECLVPFELASVLFLGAMVGSVYLSKKEALNG